MAEIKMKFIFFLEITTGNFSFRIASIIINTNTCIRRSYE